VRRVREDGRGDDASEVVREVVRRVEAAVLGAVAPALPAGGTSAGKEAQASGAAAAYAAKGLYDQRHHLVAHIVTRVVVVAPVEGGRNPRLSCGQRRRGEAAGGRGPGWRQAAGAAAKDRAVQPLLCVAKGDQVPYTLALIITCVWYVVLFSTAIGNYWGV
jgi:hypothetical protein